jgi:hypothetical protein
MHPRIQELSQYITEQRAELRAAVASVPESLRHVSPSAGRWSVDGVIEHLTMIERRVIGVITTKLAEARAAGVGRETEDTPVLPTMGIERALDRSVKLHAPELVQPKGTLTADAGLAALEESRRTVHRLIADADGLACREITHPHPVFGPTDLYTWIAFLGAHEARHADQIREIAASLPGV